MTLQINTTYFLTLQVSGTHFMIISEYSIILICPIHILFQRLHATPPSAQTFSFQTSTPLSRSQSKESSPSPTIEITLPSACKSKERRQLSHSSALLFLPDHQVCLLFQLLYCVDFVVAGVFAYIYTYSKCSSSYVLLCVHVNLFSRSLVSLHIAHTCN